MTGSCNYLNYNQEDFVSDPNEEFSDFDHLKQLLTGIYSSLPGGFNSVGNAMRASGSDDAVESNSLSKVNDYFNGSWSSLNAVDDKWSSFYHAIRNANLFLKYADTSVIEKIKYNEDYDQKKSQLKYFIPEARFLRAYFYFQLVRRYGEHIPLITESLGIDEVNSSEPSSEGDIFNFIVNECSQIADELPISYKGIHNEEFGRATRGAVMALKEKALLFAASPLFNPNNDKSKWVRAAEAAHDLIDLHHYSLEPDYNDVVNTYGSHELIFGRRDPPSNSFERNNFPVGYQGEPGTCPTQNLVNAYEMVSGLSIDDPNSNYDPDDPYKNRDPRLMKTIIVNNSEWKDRNVEIWEGGRDGQPIQFATPTGYYLKKYLIERIKITEPNPTSIKHLWVYFRYGGILLDYAEAMNEAFGPDNEAQFNLTAREAVDKVRRRVNMPDFPSGMSKDEFRKKLRSERRVELAFENHRFWDIRRWKIGSVTINIKGMAISKSNNGDFDYKEKVIQHRQWEDKMYFYPITKNELFINDKLKQNPGW